jgi:hypothetical protein
MNPKMLRYHPVRYGHQLRHFFEGVVSAWEMERHSIESKAEGLLMGVMLEDAFKHLITSHPNKVPVHVLEHADWWGQQLEHLAWREHLSFQCGPY